MSMEEGKDLGISMRLSQNRPLPLRLLQFFLFFLVLGLGILMISMYVVPYFGVQNVAVVTRSNMIVPCFEEPDNMENWIRPPSNLMHKMNDTELLWRASFAPEIKEFPFKRVPKLAFMFLSKGPLPLAPLWERFFKGHEGLYTIYVHTAPSYVANFAPSSVFYKRQIPSQVAEWGRMSMCDAERRLLANALLDISNEWFILLSESCIPLQNFSIIYRYISQSRYSFMGSFDDPGPHGRGRYNWNMQPEVRLEQWRKGPQWFEINRRLAISIVEDTTYYPKFKKFCQPACYVDEHYFQTMLSIKSAHLLANWTLTWTDWSRGGAHPATFGGPDISEEFFRRIFDRLKCNYTSQAAHVCALFARKFAPSALDPLLLLASKAFGY
uniref:Uncharacterized protein n=2 Tax=Rhizophora mucronata TaxID=61149 RepID=A0A2P2JZ01_RHIMU